MLRIVKVSGAENLMMCILIHFYTATMPIAMPPGTTGCSSSCSSVSPSAKISRSSAWTEWRNFLQLGLHWQFTKNFGEALSALLKGAKVFQALLRCFVFFKQMQCRQCTLFISQSFEGLLLWCSLAGDGILVISHS